MTFTTPTNLAVLSLLTSLTTIACTRGERGEAGPPGAQGAQGAQGERGESGTLSITGLPDGGSITIDDGGMVALSIPTEREQIFRMHLDGGMEEVQTQFTIGGSEEPLFFRPRTVPGWEVVDGTGRRLGDWTTDLGSAWDIGVVFDNGAVATLNPQTGDQTTEVFPSLYFADDHCSGPIAHSSSSARGFRAVVYAHAVWVPVPGRSDAAGPFGYRLMPDGSCQTTGPYHDTAVAYYRGAAVADWVGPIAIRKKP